MNLLGRFTSCFVILSASICWTHAITGSNCGTRNEYLVGGCCHLNKSADSTYVEAEYTTRRNLDSGERPWRLDVNLTWKNNPKNRSVKYAVNFAPTISPEDIANGQVPADLVNGHCTSVFNPFKYGDFPTRSCTVPDQWDIVDEPQYSKENLLFGFTYRLLIREYDGMVASAYTTCLTGYNYPAINTPDCMLETGGVDFCGNEPILVSGVVTNMAVLDAFEEVSDMNVTSLTAVIYWQPPVQINGNASFYTVQIIGEEKQVHFSREYPNENDTNGITRQLTGIPVSGEQYELKITPFVSVDEDIFTQSRGGKRRAQYSGPTTSIFFSYDSPTSQPLSTGDSVGLIDDQQSATPESDPSNHAVVNHSASGALPILAIMSILALRAIM